MSPQPSSPPERPRCVANPACSPNRPKCMYIHHKVSILRESRSRMYGSSYPNHMTSSRSNSAFSRILYPPGDPARIPGSSPPTHAWCDAADIPRSSSGSQSIYSYSPCMHNKPPDKGMCMYSLVDPPDPPQLFNFTQSNRKNRPFSNPSSWAVSKTWRSLERESLFNQFLTLRTSSRTERVQAWMQGSVINNNSTKNKG
jgi:hypothetical protein